MSNPIAIIKTADVTAALTFFIKISMILDVDREGYVYNSALPDNKRIKIGKGDQEKFVVVYREELPKDDIYVINPFAEGLGDQIPPQIFFYKIQRAALNARISYAVDGILQLALEQHDLQTSKSKSNKKEEEPPPLRVGVRITNILTRKTSNGGSIVDDVDDKMRDEFRKFFDKFGDQAVEPVYKSSQQRSDINISILDDPGFLMNLGFMRKKSIAVLQAIIRGIFDIKDNEGTERFSSKRIENCPSKFSSWLQSLYLLYKPLNEVIDVLPDETAPDHLVDLDIYQYHLDRLPAYTNNAKWMIQSAPPVADPTPTRQPGVPPQLTPIQHSYNPVAPRPATEAPPGYKLMPGVIMADGTRGPPMVVPDMGQVQQAPVPGLVPQQNYGVPQLFPNQYMTPQPGYYNQPQYAQPPIGGGYPTGGFVNAMMPNPQTAFGGGFSGIPGMPPIR